jgi:hypothetical protein
LMGVAAAEEAAASDPTIRAAAISVPAALPARLAGRSQPALATATWMTTFHFKLG